MYSYSNRFISGNTGYITDFIFMLIFIERCCEVSYKLMKVSLCIYDLGCDPTLALVHFGPEHTSTPPPGRRDFKFLPAQAGIQKPAVTFQTHPACFLC